MRCFLALPLFCFSICSAQNYEPGATPIPRLTPGATLDVSKQDICTAGYTKKVRNVPAEIKRHVFELYGLTYIPKTYEVDHLVPLETGGSNRIKNLWPEPYDLTWGARVKDALENKLHTMVCAGDISLEEAQREIATDWIGAYRRFFHTDEPIHRESGRRKRSRNY